MKMVKTIQILEKILYAVDRILTVCVLIFAAGCITTFFHHTTYRYVCRTFVVCLFCGIIGNLVLNIIEYILVEFSKKERVATILPYEVAEKRKKKFEKEWNIVLGSLFAAIVVARIMVGGFSQSWRGDSWWTVLDYSSILFMPLFGAGKAMQMRLFANILEASTSK